MACLQNGTTLLNNNNLSSFKHNIMKYDETHANMWSNSPQINNFLNKNCQIPFRNNNHTKEKTQSENVFNKEEIHSCVNNDDVISEKLLSDNESEEICANTNQEESAIINNNTELQHNASITPKTNTAHDKNESGKLNKPFQMFKTSNENKKPLEGWTQVRKNIETSHIYSDETSCQKELYPSTIESESGEPSHHARRPMNAFLIFCKRHRTVVKNRYPHLENRAVTKILGEWWAALETEEKACYTELAKQYKNAFFSANPNFKWYKLPAPPLRTLNTRPGNIVKSPPPPKQPPEVEEQPQQLFTPGKLADETQLGSITSLINSDNHVVKTSAPISKSNVTDAIKADEPALSAKSDYKNYLLSPPPSNVEKLSQPPKPFKKRVLHQHKDNKNIVRSIFCSDEPEQNIFDSLELEQALENFVDTVNNESFSADENDFGENADQRPLNSNTNSNLTQQEIINKVVDHMCSTKSESNDSNTEDVEDSDCNTCLQNQAERKSKETRKSVRSCKGLRYAKFMAEGKLFVNKRNKKHMSMSKLPKPSSSNASDKVPRNSESIELMETIKKLAERTIGNSSKMPETNPEFNDCASEMNEHEESREETMRKMFRAADFNLDEKIEALPSLSLDKFQQKKKENKKRKFLRATKMKHETDHKKSSPDVSRSDCDENRNKDLIGSRKRKPRKESISRLDLEQQSSTGEDNIPTASSSTELDLFGLATLAEVAAKKAKIDQK